MAWELKGDLEWEEGWHERESEQVQNLEVQGFKEDLEWLMGIHIGSWSKILTGAEVEAQYFGPLM